MERRAILSHQLCDQLDRLIAGEDSQLQLPSQHLLEHVLRLTQDPQTILNALAASKDLRLAAAQLIECIMIREAVPPDHTWDIFPRATRVRIHRYRQVNEHLYFLRAILATLPSHITATEGLDDEPAIRDLLSEEASLSFAQALVASACCSSLLSVNVGSGLLTSAAADVILQGLPSLQEARLWVITWQPISSGQQHVWRPKGHSRQDLVLLSINGDGPGELSVDLAGLRSATQLQRLSFDSAIPTNLAALQALSNLQHLDLGSTDCPAASWAVLAKLPKLDTLNVWSLEISASAPAAVVKRLNLEQGFCLQHSEAQLPGCLARQLPQLPGCLARQLPQLPGCLARQLPQLQHLKMEVKTGMSAEQGQDADMQLATALQVHQQLKELHASLMECAAKAWALLAALPRLETVHVRAVVIDATAPAATALSSLMCDSLCLMGPGLPQVLQLRGCLSRQLPQLRHLRPCSAHVTALAAALAGHEQLQQLSVKYHDEFAGPKLGWGQDVLAELASCSRLQELELELRWGGAMRGGAGGESGDGGPISQGIDRRSCGMHVQRHMAD